MQTTDTIRERRSVRAFTAEAVPHNTVEKILDLAKFAPSWANTQDWNVYAVTGEPLARIRRAVKKAADRGAHSEPDLAMPERDSWPPYLAERMVYRSQTPPEGARPPAMPDSSELYGAPWLLLFAINEELQPAYSCFDAGLLVQTICLIAEDRGLSTCIMAMAVRFAEALHREIPQAKGKKFLVGVALGYMDAEAPVNRPSRKRADTAEIVTWLE